jgi:hypothetical protein
MDPKDIASAYDVATESLLIDGYSNDLLPTNTVVFPSTLQPSKVFDLVKLIAISLGVILFFIGLIVSSVGLIGASVAILLLATAALYFLYLRESKFYKEALAGSSIMSGVIVFASGDLVVKFDRLLARKERTIENVYILTAAVKNQFAPFRLFEWPLFRLFRQYLVISFLTEQGRQTSIEICQTDLHDHIQKICDYINNQKNSRMASAF